MIRSNLATRPFYNERAVRLSMAAAAIVALIATGLNVLGLVTYSRNDTALASQAANDETRAAQLRTSAARLRATVDPRQIEFASVEARQANSLIDRRTFSWTDLFNQFETTLPDQARITAVRPKVDPKKGIVLTVTVVARGIDDVNQLMENLEGTGAFADLLPPEQHFDDQGLLEATLEMTYRPGHTPPATGNGAGAVTR